MDTMSAMMRGLASRDNELRVFDWEKAAMLIKKHNAKDVDAGLEEDWFWTAAPILENGEMLEDCGAYLASTWATPVIKIDGEKISCYKMKSKTPNWDADTRYPDVFKKILFGA